MNFNCIILWFCFLLVSATAEGQVNQHYTEYHTSIVSAETLISKGNFEEALEKYDQVFLDFDFIFSKDYKIAAQVALYIDQRQRAFQYIKAGITTGWNLNKLKKNKFLSPLQNDNLWQTIEEEYDSLYNQYLIRIDQGIRDSVYLQFKEDQAKAIAALFRIGDKAQEKYALKKFAPHSETQMSKLFTIMENQGYPGEKLIGNNYWMSTILSHHNSITKEYVQRDTLYKFIKPKLIEALAKGQLSPFEYALFDDWQKAVSSDRTEPGYGFLNPPNKSTLTISNELRKAIGLRSVELRNKLVDVESKTGISFYLPSWVEGKIIVRNE